MATGPQRARLDRALAGADEGAINARAAEWDKCRDILNQISFALATASPEVKEKIGGRTGPAIDAAFTRSAQHMSDKAAELVEGAQALRNAADVITSAKTEQTDLASHPLTKPPAYQAPVGPPTRADIQAESQNRQAHADYDAAYAGQEARAKKQADEMDRVFGHSTATMKKIHGEPDEPPRHDSAGGSSGGAAGGSSGGSVPAGTSGGGPRHTDGPRPGSPGSPGTPVPGSPGGPGPGYVPGNPGANPGSGGPQGGSPVDPVSVPASGGTAGGVLGTTGSTPGGVSAGTGLGLAGAAAGGAAGGLLGTGMTAGGLRGAGLTPIVSNPGTAAGGVRGIGATSRTGVTGGALGRPGGVGATSQGSSARAGSASAAGRRGTTGGSRGAAGGRGTGATASGRGGRGKDDRKGRRKDVFDTGDEWVEDEDVAPGVLA